MQSTCVVLPDDLVSFNMDCTRAIHDMQYAL